MTDLSKAEIRETLRWDTFLLGRKQGSFLDMFDVFPQDHLSHICI